MRIGILSRLTDQTLVRRATRRGGVSLYFLLALPVLCLTVALAVYATQLGRVSTDLQKAGDAAALAAVQTLVDDRTLIDDPQARWDLLAEARREAVRYAAENEVYGRSLELYANPGNEADGDVVFGVVPSARSRQFLSVDLREGGREWLSGINAVRITARQTGERGNAPLLNDGPLLSRTANDVSRPATAMLDRAVIGLRPVDAKPIPLAPVALLSDPSGETGESWEYQVELRGGPDGWHYDRQLRRCEPAFEGDGIHEMVVRLRVPRQDDTDASAAEETPGPGRANACLLQIGARDFSALCGQMLTGVVREHLAEYGGKFALGVDNTLVVRGSPLGPRPDSAEHALLVKSLQQLQLLGEPRIWPLFSRFDEGTDLPVVTGFVAARVAEVHSGGGDVLFVLQPCVLSLPGVLTESSRRSEGPPPPMNRYLCKVRLVE
jgi:hypothetical protein